MLSLKHSKCKNKIFIGVKIVQKNLFLSDAEQNISGKTSKTFGHKICTY